MATSEQVIDWQKRWGSLNLDYSGWRTVYQDVSRHLLPYSGRFLTTDRNRGEWRLNSIYDSTATQALTIFGAGMMSGATSPARPWIKMTTADDTLMQSEPVKVWLNEITQRMLAIFAKGNTYRTLHSMYEELGCYGTAANIVADDFHSVIHNTPLTAGEYRINTSFKGEVCTLYRQFDMQVAQMVGQFGRDRCSHTVRNLYDRGQLDTWVTVMHAIEPRADRDASKRDATNMPWASIYFEFGADHTGATLRESGFKNFRALAPRWRVFGQDVYGVSPGMMALGDIKQLQHEQLRKGQGIDYMTKPPVQAPTAMKNHEVDMLPGGVSYVDAAGPGGGIRSTFEVNLRLDYLLEDIRDVRERINAAFYADLFLMLYQSDRGQMTATEVAERHEEKLLMIGPALERLHNEALAPLVEITFERMLEVGLVPPPPPEMEGQPLNVEFVSILAQAQRAIGNNAMDRYVMGLGTVAALKPEVLDRFDADQWAEIYADGYGVDPRILVPDSKVALIRQQRAQQQQAAQQAALMQAGADTAQKLAGADTNGQNALTDVMGMLSGYGAPGAR